jgi:predicted phosphodiesterase
MAAQTEIRHAQAREILRYHGNVNKTALARMLVADDPITWDSVDQARNYIRRITGTYGKHSNTKTKDKTLFENENMKKSNIYGLQPERHNDVTPYIIPKSQKKIGVACDGHIPYQDNYAVETALDYFKDKNCDTILLNGDWMDCFMASKFQKDPNQRDLKGEIDDMKAFLSALRKEFPKQLIIYKEGNHEVRWKHFLMRKAPEVFNMSEFRLDVILGLAPLGIIWVDNKKIIKAGKLNIIHGHEYWGSYSPVNPAKGYYNKALTNVMAGHNHQSSEHISKDLNEEITGAWSVGCLCEMHPDYAPYNKWVHGFATVDIIDDAGNFRVINKMILNGDVV